MRRTAMGLGLGLVLACTRTPSPAAEEPSMPQDPKPPTTSPPSGSSASASADVITDPSQCEAAVGRTVTVIGVLQRSKIPTVLGIDVEEVSSLADKKVVVKGVLRKRVVVEPPDKSGLHAASRGSGTFYYLVDPSGKGLAKPVLYTE